MDFKNFVNKINGKRDEEISPEEEFVDDSFSGIDIDNSVFKDIPDDSQEISGSALEFNDEFDENNSDSEEELNSDEISPMYNEDVPTAMNSVSRYQSIDSAQQGFDVISGINDIPQHYRDDNLLPELVMPSIQYNNFQTKADVAEWQVKARSLLRKHEIYKPEYSLSPRDIAGYTYLNDLQLWRATRGFERKMSNNNLSGVIEENSSEASPDAQPKRKSAFASMFGG